MKHLYREVHESPSGDTYKDFYNIRDLLVCRITINERIAIYDYDDTDDTEYAYYETFNKVNIFWAMVTNNSQPSTKLHFKLSGAIGDAYAYRLAKIRYAYHSLINKRFYGIFTRKLNQDDLSYDFYYKGKHCFNLAYQLGSICVYFVESKEFYKWDGVTNKAIMQEISTFVL